MFIDSGGKVENGDKISFMYLYDTNYPSVEIIRGVVTAMFTTLNNCEFIQVNIEHINDHEVKNCLRTFKVNNIIKNSFERTN